MSTGYGSLHFERQRKTNRLWAKRVVVGVVLLTVLCGAVVASTVGRSLLPLKNDNVNCLKPKKCVFPFTYRGKTYSECSTYLNNNQPWCAFDANYVGGRWTNCNNIPNDECADVRNCLRPKNCTFPFTYQGKSFSQCTSYPNSIQPWCALNATYVWGKWMYCNGLPVDQCDQVMPRPTGAPSQQAPKGNCDPNQEKFISSAGTCVVCLNSSAKPTIIPQKCPAGTYYDEEDTCSCVACLKNCCCPGGDLLVDCPIGSFQQQTGAATCTQAVVSAQTNGFSYDVTRPLFTHAQNRVTLNTVVANDLNCPAEGIGEVASVISGFNLPSSNSMFSIQVGAVMVSKRSARVTVTKLAGSQIAGFATSLALSCLPADSVMSLGTMRATGLTATPKIRIVKTNMKCDGTEKVFAALNEIENSASAKRLSISLKSSTRVNKDDLVRARLEFSSASKAAALGASVVTFCASPDSMLAPRMIQTGLVDGGAMSPTQEVVKTVKLKNNMGCSNPRVALGLTQLDATGTLAINLELLQSSVSATSFRMKFVSMGQTIVKNIQAAYLVTCPMDPKKVQADIDKTCSPAK